MIGKPWSLVDDRRVDRNFETPYVPDSPRVKRYQWGGSNRSGEALIRRWGSNNLGAGSGLPGCLQIHSSNCDPQFYVQ